MSKALRLSERWFRRGLWLVALAFAGFLIGLGGAVVGDLSHAEAPPVLDDFLDMARVAPLREQVRQATAAQDQAQAQLAQAELAYNRARAVTSSERESFDNWRAARSATQRAEHDPQVLTRMQALDTLGAHELQARQAMQAQKQALLDARQSAQAARAQLATLEAAGRERLRAAQDRRELQVFLYRLALTLPLLVVAGWLFAKKRKSTWWPFVWGFIGFAVFAFFVELVPYLPDYGGYVRYGVGVVVTVLAGRYAILALQRYLERQRSAEQQPETERRRALDYDVAQARLAKGACPGCERAVDLKDGQTDFCPHCGIGLFVHCGHCNARHNAFVRYCPACGEAARAA